MIYVMCWKYYKRYITIMPFVTNLVDFEPFLIQWQVCRGTAVMLVAPTDGTEEIANPFLQPDAVAS